MQRLVAFMVALGLGYGHGLVMPAIIGQLGEDWRQLDNSTDRFKWFTSFWKPAPEQAKTSMSSWLLPLLAVVLIVVAVAVGYYVYSKKKKSSDGKGSQVSSTTSNSA